MSSTASDAKLKVDEFEKRSSGSDWLVIKKDDLVKGLRDRIDHPDHINTRVVNLCGPGAFFRFLAMDDPVMYAQAVISLWEKNTAMIGNRSFKPIYSLRIAKVPSGMDPVDWVPLASLRDDENSVINYDDGDGGLSGLTMPSGLEKWFKQAGYTDVRNVTNLILNKGVDNIKEADRWTLAGYRVCLLIDGDILESAKQNNSSLYPDHWVGLQRNSVNIKNDNFSAKVHSWGKIMPIPEMGTMTVKTFLDMYYGYVAAKPA